MINRPMATIQRISNISNIPGKDRIELATILGWQVIVPKNVYKINDVVVFLELGAIVPPNTPWAIALSRTNWTVKTLKLSGVISQGYVVPLKDIGIKEKNVSINDDVSKKFNITKYIPNYEYGNMENVKSKKSFYHNVILFLLNYKLFRLLKINVLLKRKDNDLFPTWISKTDEPNFQGYNKFNEMNEVYATVKYDGSSITFWYNKKIHVCSRNLKLTENNNNSSKFYQGIRNENIEEKIKNSPYIFQGELCGTGIQGNPLNLDSYKIFIFNVLLKPIKGEKAKRLSHREARQVCEKYNLRMVEEVSNEYIIIDKELDKRRQQVLDLAEGVYSGTKNNREGIVLRCVNDENISCKVISNSFRMKMEKT